MKQKVSKKIGLKMEKSAGIELLPLNDLMSKNLIGGWYGGSSSGGGGGRSLYPDGCPFSQSTSTMSE